MISKIPGQCGSLASDASPHPVPLWDEGPGATSRAHVKGGYWGGSRAPPIPQVILPPCLPHPRALTLSFPLLKSDVAPFCSQKPLSPRAALGPGPSGLSATQLPSSPPVPTALGGWLLQPLPNPTFPTITSLSEAEPGCLGRGRKEGSFGYFSALQHRAAFLLLKSKVALTAA